MLTITVTVDPESLDQVRPLLKRDGMNVSSFLRKSINDYIDKKAVPDKWEDRKHGN